MTTAVQPRDRTIEANGLRLHVLEWPGREGATPLVLLHGLSGAAGDWRRIAEHFAGEYHVYAIDQRGHGESDRAEAYGTDEAVADLEAAVDALGLERFVLCGHSMGGMNTIAYSARHPERVICALANDIPPAFERQGDADQPSEHPVFPDREAWKQQRRENSPLTPDWALDLLAESRLKAVDGGFQPKHDIRAGAGWRWPDLWDEARGITRPIFFIRGGRSRVLSAETLMKMDMEIEPARSITLEQSGHDTYLDMEHEWLSAAEAFFAAHSR